MNRWMDVHIVALPRVSRGDKSHLTKLYFSGKRFESLFPHQSFFFIFFPFLGFSFVRYPFLSFSASILMSEEKRGRCLILLNAVPSSSSSIIYARKAQTIIEVKKKKGVCTPLGSAYQEEQNKIRWKKLGKNALGRRSVLVRKGC